MIRIESHGDVRRIVFSWWRSRVLGYDVSVYLVKNVAIDTAFPGVAADFARLLRETRPKQVIVTHQHEDHAGNAELVPPAGMPLVMGSETREALSDQPRMGNYRLFAWGPWRSPELASSAAVTPPPDAALRMIFTPGHSPDHYVVWDPDTETIFGGDLFLGVKVRVARPGENPRDLAASLRRVAALKPRRFFDAHRGLIPDPVGAMNAKASWIEEMVGKIDRLADQGLSATRIRDRVLGREHPVILFTQGDLSKINFVRSVLANRP